MSQTDKLHELLSDGQWHDTPTILEKVYGASHLGIARISARVHDLQKKLPPHQIVQSRKKNCKQPLWEYRIATVDVYPAQQPRMDLFGHAAEAV